MIPCYVRLRWFLTEGRSAEDRKTERSHHRVHAFGAYTDACLKKRRSGRPTDTRRNWSRTERSYRVHAAVVPVQIEKFPIVRTIFWVFTRDN